MPNLTAARMPCAAVVFAGWLDNLNMLTCVARAVLSSAMLLPCLCLGVCFNPSRHGWMRVSALIVTLLAA